MEELFPSLSTKKMSLSIDTSQRGKSTRERESRRRGVVVVSVFKSVNSSLLARPHHELVKRIKSLLINVQTDFNILSNADKKLLNEAQTSIDSIFLLVVVGEFNSGKSQFINTLLGEKEEICPTGVLPTTDVIHILRYASKRRDLVESDNVKSIYLPNEWLRQTNIVDTPGTNAILQTHQQITGIHHPQPADDGCLLRLEHFIPQSDYILFVTSVDRPFSESEVGLSSILHPVSSTFF